MTLKRQRKTHWLLYLAAIAGLAGGAGWHMHQRDNNSSETEMALITVSRGDIEDVVTAQGKLEPKDYVDVGTQVSGQLKKLHVEIGDKVKAGDLLAEIDPQVYRAKVEANEARLKTLQAQIQEQNAQIALARQQNLRNIDLYKAKAISQDALQTTQFQLKVSQAQLAALQAQVEEAQSTLEGDKANLGYTKIYAPMDGTVVTQSTKEGQTVNASQSAPVIVQLANLAVMTVRAQVAEADVSRLSVGMPVWFTTLGSQRRWNATVRQILPTPETINDVVLYNVLVDVDNSDGQLMTGMSTQMFFVAGSAKDVPTLPVAALGKHLAKQDDETGQAYMVRVPEGRTAVEKTIRVGLMDRTAAEIKSGLSEGDRVVMPARPAGVDNNIARGAGGGRRGGFGPRL